MSYFVNLGGINLHAVQSVKVDADRDIQEYDGLGSGKFDVPGNAGLKKYTFACQLRQYVDPRFTGTWSASELFKQLDTWRAQKEPVRFVKTSSQYPAENLSTLVTLESYSVTEKFAGINDTEITVKEFKDAHVKTTSVPYITRPGKIPIPPKVTITKSNTAYSAAKKITGVAPKAGEKGFIGPLQVKTGINFSNVKTGKPATNPAAVKNGTTVKVTTPQSINSINFNSGANQGVQRSWGDVGNAISSGATAVGNAISGAFSDWQKKTDAFNKKLGW